MRLPESRPRWLLELPVAALALAGFALIYRLALQAARGFDQGCGGFNPDALTEDPSGCATAFSSEYVAFLGIENTTLGMTFYACVLGLSLLFWLFHARFPLLRLSRLVFVGLSSLYAWYLVYILFSGKAGAVCELCLASHGITTVILLLLSIDFFIPHRHVNA